MICRLVVSGFNGWPKLISTKGKWREKEIRSAEKRLFDRNAEVRASAINFIVALLANGSVTTKESILGNRLLISPVVRYLPMDTNDTLLPLLNCLRIHVLLDNKISRSAKSTFFNIEQFLVRIMCLHGRKWENFPSQEISDLNDAVQQFLVDACTTPGNGVCYEDRGWYPKLDPAAYDSDSQIHNGSLLRLLSQLGPVENEFHRFLTLRILETCAELRAPYLSTTQNPAQPSLTFNFISEVSLWKEIITMPLPKPFTVNGNLPVEPPPTTTVLANIMPTVLTQQYLTNGLFHKSALVRYDTCQIVFAILSKTKELKDVIHSGGSLWRAQLDVIFESLSRRLPEISSILKLYSLNSGYPLAANCTMKVLSLYSEVLSNVTPNQKIDAKPLIAAVQSDWTFATPIDLLDKIHLLRFIHEHNEVNWWSRQGAFNG
jgi:nucleolar pre-ribosomal-associated protein 1